MQNEGPPPPPGCGRCREAIGSKMPTGAVGVRGMFPGAAATCTGSDNNVASLLRLAFSAANSARASNSSPSESESEPKPELHGELDLAFSCKSCAARSAASAAPVGFRSAQRNPLPGASSRSGIGSISSVTSTSRNLIALPTERADGKLVGAKIPVGATGFGVTASRSAEVLVPTRSSPRGTDTLPPDTSWPESLRVIALCAQAAGGGAETPDRCAVKGALPVAGGASFALASSPSAPMTGTTADAFRNLKSGFQRTLPVIHVNAGGPGLCNAKSNRLTMEGGGETPPC